jgi:hypothetical protein
MKQKALKFLSLICALALMLSGVSVGFVAFAAEGTITLTETSNDATIPEGENLLANGDFSFALKDTSKDGIYSHDMGSGYADYKAKLTDDILEVKGQNNRAVWTNSNFTAANLGNGDDSQRGKNYFYQVVVDIKGTADIEKFYLFGLPDSYTPMRYDVSFASSEADLFTANATSYYYDYQDNGGVFRGQIFDVANVNARYVGIRAYRLGNNATFYLSEIGVIGSNIRELPSVKSPVTTNSVYLPEGENLIDENTGFSFKTVYDNGGTYVDPTHGEIGMSVFGGTNSKGVVNNTKVTMNYVSGVNGAQVNGAIVRTVYGGNESSSITGSTKVLLNGGKITNSAIGGCYNSVKPGLGNPSWETNYYVTGSTFVYISDEVLMTFDDQTGIKEVDLIFTTKKYDVRGVTATSVVNLKESSENHCTKENATLQCETQAVYDNLKNDNRISNELIGKNLVPYDQLVIASYSE